MRPQQILLVAAVLTAPLISGCVSANLHTSKALVLSPKPGDSKVGVVANAHTKCLDYWIWQTCTLELDLAESK